jgi:phosphoesterase RecJ-like protein
MHIPPPIPVELTDAFKKYSNFVIIGHEHPDSDSIHSQICVGKLLQYFGKMTYLVSTGPFSRPEIFDYSPKFLKHVPPGLEPSQTLAVIVDCSSPDRIDYLADEISEFATAVIDHHAAGQKFGDIHYIDSKAFSVTFLIHHIFKSLSVPITEETAHMLLYGLATDTGYFRHIGPYRGEVFSSASELVEAGASPRDIYAGMYGQKSFVSRKLLGLLLSRMEHAFRDKLIYTWETAEEMQEYGELNRDSETLYAQMLSIFDCEVILYIRENNGSAPSCTVGFRSHADSKVDVGKIAAEFGGGGHRKAAGVTMNGTIKEAVSLLIERFELEFTF